jgi:hypothetical protein
VQAIQWVPRCPGRDHGSRHVGYFRDHGADHRSTPSPFSPSATIPRRTRLDLLGTSYTTCLLLKQITTNSIDLPFSLCHDHDRRSPVQWTRRDRSEPQYKFNSRLEWLRVTIPRPPLGISRRLGLVRLVSGLHHWISNHHMSEHSRRHSSEFAPERLLAHTTTGL